MKLYLLRHAQSANNLIFTGNDNVEGRDSDPEITETGRQQAKVLAGHLSHHQGETRQQPFNPNDDTRYGLTHVYCSLMTRSILTAEYVAEACGLALEALPDYFEKYGIYEFDEQGQRQGLPGPNRKYFEERFPGLKLPDEIDSDGWWNRPAETTDEFIKRMHSVVSDLKQRHAGSDDCVAIVAHGDFIDQFVNELMSVPRHNNNYEAHWTANWTFHNTSISRIDFIGAAHTVVYLNRGDHLPMDLITW